MPFQQSMSLHDDIHAFRAFLGGKKQREYLQWTWLGANEHLRIGFVREHAVATVSFVLIPIFGRFACAVTAFSIVVRHGAISIVNPLWTAEVRLLSHPSTDWRNWKSPRRRFSQEKLEGKGIHRTRLNASFFVRYCLVWSCWKCFTSWSKSSSCSRSSFFKQLWLCFTRSATFRRCFSSKRLLSKVICSWKTLYSRSSLERSSIFSFRQRSSN